MNFANPKSIQTENVEDQSQQEDVPSKGKAEPVGLVGGGNKNKGNKDGGLEDQTQTVKQFVLNARNEYRREQTAMYVRIYITSSVTELLKNK